MQEGEDPIIIKPGVYPGATGKREGICIVVDDGDTWKVEKEEAGRIHISFPNDGKWIVVPDFTPPFPDPPVAEDPPVKRKKKVAILRVNGDFNGFSSDAPGEFTIKFKDRNVAPPVANPAPK